GADVAEDHEGRCAALPALADVGAVGLLADRVQALVLDCFLQAPVGGAARRRHLQPGRLALPKRAPGERRGAARIGPRAGDVDAVDGLGHDPYRSAASIGATGAATRAPMPPTCSASSCS